VTRLTCEQAELLLGARALDVLSAEETRQLDEHVRGCAEHAEVLSQLRRTVSVMPMLVDDREPPPALRDRIMDAVRRETQHPASSITMAAGATKTEALRRPLWLGVGSSMAFRRLAVAAAIVLAVGLGFAAGSRTGQPALRTWALTGTQSAPAAQGALVYAPGQQSAVLTVSGLPSLQVGQVYEAWLIRNGAPVDVGVSRGANGKLVLAISRNVSDYQVVAITIEPGEQPKPTTTPIVAANLS
jgi:anti-sigma-K factor RskA